MSVPGLLELFHPIGSASGVVVLGSACPPTLAVPSAVDVAAHTADLVVIAPSLAESRESGWLERAVRMAAEAIAQDGVVYMLVSRRHATVRRHCRRAGLVIERDVVHAPNWLASHHAIPACRSAFTRVVATSSSLSPGRRRVAAALLALPGAIRALSIVRGSVAVVARPQGARPLFAWMLRLAGSTDSSAADVAVIVRAKWRAGQGTVVLQAVDGTARPFVLAKTRLTPSPESSMHEIDLVTRFGPAARAAGAAVPDARLARVGMLSVVVENVVPGVPAAVLLNARQLPVDMALDRVASWLEEWHRRTVTHHPLAPDYLDRAILRPAHLLAPHLDEGARYLEWLEAKCRAVSGDVVPLVATHGDLTMSNVLVAGEGPIGIVDWEMAGADGLPLADLWYAATDAVSALNRYADREGAFVRCMSGDDSFARRLHAHVNRLANAIGASDAFTTLCFHGCWLQHAANEQRKRAPGEARPFLDIVRWIAAHPRLAGVPAGTAA